MSTLKTTNLQHASAASPAIVLAADGSATAQLSSINGGPLAGSRNRVINGDMRIDARNNGASVTIGAATNTYVLDRWYAYGNAASKFSVQRNAGSVTPPAGFTNYLGVTSLSAYSVPPGEQYVIGHRIEGFNSADLDFGTANAKTVTLSFWVRSSIAGTHGGQINNAAYNRSYPFSYTISAANTWEYKTLVVTGDATGTWLSDNWIGLVVGFNLGSGSTFSSTANAWATGNYSAPTGAVSIVGANGATFYITGVQLEPGTVATPFERRSYGQELALCQRYFYLQKNYMGQSAPFNSEATGAIAQSTATTVVYRAVRIHPVEMRATPSVTWANLDFWDGGVQRSVTGINNNNSSLYVRSVDWNMTGNMSGLGRPAYEFVQPSGFIACSAEL